MQLFWTGALGDNNFDNGANWLPLGVPGSTDDAVINLAVPTTITVTPETTVNSLSTSSSVTVAISNERFFLIGAATSANPTGASDNMGTIQLNADEANTELYLDGNVTLTGGGIVLLSDNQMNSIVGTGTLDNVNNTIEGAGTIGNGDNGGLSLTNAGVIDADDINALNLQAPGATFVNTGTIEATNTTTGNGGLIINSTTINGGSTSNPGVILATGVNSHVDLASATIIGGELETTQGGVIDTLDRGTAFENATIAAGTDVVILNNDAITASGTLTNAGVLALDSTGSATSLVISGTVTLSGGGTVDLSDSPLHAIYGTGTLDNLDNTIEGAGTIGNAENPGFALTNSGLIDATGANALQIMPDGAAFTNTSTGVLEASGSGGLNLFGTGVNVPGVLMNDGELFANGGSIRILNGLVIEGSGTDRISGSSSLQFSVAATNTSQTVIFDAGATGTLDLENSQMFQGSIQGLSTDAQNAIDLADISFSGNPTATFSGNASSGVLTVVSGAESTQLDLIGNYLGLHFGTATDGQGGTIVTASPCYCPGTLILTDCGERQVEALVIGDIVVTASGQHRPVKWIGNRSYSGRFLAANPGVQPVRFSAGSLGNGLPCRDLLVSPEHAMFLDGLLIPARCLVNGTTIAQEPGLQRVDYFHVELETHDVLLAEGAPSESFMDDDSRGMFHNASGFAALYPDRTVSARFCAPRVDAGYQLETIRLRLATAAGEIAAAA